MQEITHRQMRNDSGDVLRRVAAGETIVVTNKGRPAAVIGPPPVDVLSHLSTLGQLRASIDDPSRLQSIRRAKSVKKTSEILDDTRGRW